MNSRIMLAWLLLVMLVIGYRLYSSCLIDNSSTSKISSPELSTQFNQKLLQTNHVRTEYPELSLIGYNTRSSLDLSNVVGGKSTTLDYRGNPYYFFVFNPDHDIYVSRSMLQHGGVWESFLNDLLLHLVEREKNETQLVDTEQLHVIDCGANLGSFTLYAASLHLSVLAFEMQQLVYTLLQMSVRISGYADHVQIYNTALWNESRTVSFNVMRRNYGGTWMREDSKGKNGTLQSIRLDSLPVFQQPAVLHNIFFMKLDIEGAEERALRGFDSVINARRVKYIAIGDSASNHLNVYKWLYEIGYTCRNFGPAFSSSLNAECRNLYDNSSPRCNWETWDQLRKSFRAIKFGNLNVVCRLDTTDTAPYSSTH